MDRERLIALLAAPLICACGGDPDADPTPETSDDVAPDPLGHMVDEGCPQIFEQEIFPVYRVTISDEEWDELEYEFLNRAEREEMGLDHNPYHPVELEYEGESIPNVSIKLRGQSSWWHAIELDDPPKMQFTLAFNEIDPDGRFYGVRKVALDMPRSDASFLRQRISLYYLRRAGVPAQCANNARLIINGEYYGLYTHMEKLDKEFVQRVYGDLDDGTLWEGGWLPRTNEDDPDWDRYEEFLAARTPGDIETFVDLDASLKEWAAEAMAPHGDGYYNGRANFYLYDHPVRGYIWIPHDLDSGFDFLPAEMSPLFPTCANRWFDDRRHWAVIMDDPEAQARFIDQLAAARDLYDADVLADRVSEWSAQIHDAADDDPHKPFTMDDHQLAVDDLRSYPSARAETIDRFLDCRANGGEDADGDGYDFCFDCRDDAPSAYPGAEEVCNDLDDDCDGQTDETPNGEEMCL